MGKVRSEYEIGLRDDTARGATSIKKEFAGIARAAADLGPLLAGLGVGTAFAALASATGYVINFGDHLNDLSKSTGASVEQLSFLDYAAKQSGSSLDGLTSSVGKMQKNLADVAKGATGPAAKALQTLGISAKELVKQDLVTQLGTLGDAISKIQNPAERTAVGMAVFGKAFREIAGLLAEGKAGFGSLVDEFVRLGGVVTKAQTDKFDALNDSLGRFRLAAFGASLAISDKLAGPLTQLVDLAANGVPKVGGFFDDVGAALKNLGVNALSAVPQLSMAANLIAEVTRAPQPKLRGFSQFGPPRPTKEQIDAQLRFKIGNGGPSAGTTDGLSDTEQTAIERRKKAQDDYVSSLRKQLTLQVANTEEAKVLADIAADTSGKFDKNTKDTALALARQLDLIKERDKRNAEGLEVQLALNGYVKERADLEAKADTALQARARTITESLQTPLENYIEAVKELQGLREHDRISDETVARGIKKAADEMANAQQNAAGLKDAVKDLGLTFSSAFEDAVLGASKFSDVLKGLAQDIARLLIRKSITEPLLKQLDKIDLFGGSSSGGGGFSDFSALGFGGGKASGGNVSRGKFYVVGEKGPELFAPGMSGSIVPHGGQAPIINIYEAPPNTRAQVNPNGRDVDIFVGGSLAKNISSGRGGQLGLRPPLAAR